MLPLKNLEHKGLMLHDQYNTLSISRDLFSPKKTPHSSPVVIQK